MKRNSGFSKLGCFSLSGLGLGTLVVLVLAGVTLAQGGSLFSPGALNAVAGAQLGGARSHAEVPCSGCHPLPWSGQTMTHACLACHTDLTQNPKNFHNVMVAQGTTAGCIQCHTDHGGANATQTKLNTQGFPHNAVGFALAAHQKMAAGTPFTCADCHKTSFANFDPTVCATCHFDINSTFLTGHVTTFGQSCLDCHDGLDTYGHAFDHSKATFALAGKHGLLTCDQCHAGAANIAALKAAPQDCYSCHAKNDAHKGGFGRDCAQCHTPDSWQSAKVDHNKTTFPLVGKHQAVACNACHLNGVFKGTPATCYACHAKDDTHKGGFGQDCTQCHTPDSWQSATVDHNKTAFPLTGKHQAVVCSACHVNKVFKGTPTACGGCHADPVFHKGLFGTNCASCHTTSGWTPAKFNGAHPFPINHGGASGCAACHPASLAGYTCFTCHEQAQMVDRHPGVSATDLPKCVKCHPAGTNGN